MGECAGAGLDAATVVDTTTTSDHPVPSLTRRAQSFGDRVPAAADQQTGQVDQGGRTVPDRAPRWV